MEHKSWMLPQMRYTRDGVGIRAEEPEVSGRPVSEFVTFMLDRICCFVEEVSVYYLQRRMPPGVTITALPLSTRDPEMPERFRITLAVGGSGAWDIRYHQSKFEET